MTARIVNGKKYWGSHGAWYRVESVTPATSVCVYQASRNAWIAQFRRHDSKDCLGIEIVNGVVGRTMKDALTLLEKHTIRIDKGGRA